MKKFDFFSMFLVALLAFLGTEAKAQYKSVDAAKVSVTVVLQSTPTMKDALNPGTMTVNTTNSTISSSTVIDDQYISNLYKNRFGQFLLKEFNNGNSVGGALDKLTEIVNQTSQTVPARGLKMAETETFYRNLLKL